MDKIRTAVVGAGKMGSIHAKVYNQLEQSELVAVVDVQKDSADRLASLYGCDSYSDISEIIGKVDAVTISAPTILHKEFAEELIKNKISVLIEKPLATSASEGKKIVSLAKKHGVVAAVGHSERCNPVVQALKKLEIEPKFIDANRVSPYPFRSTDIGVVLDVMIHDIDIILSMTSGKVKRVDAVGVNVIGEHEDICNARIVFDNGCVANVTASRLALTTSRKVRLFSSKAYLSLDYFKKDGIIVQADSNVDVVKRIRDGQFSGFDFSNMSWPDMLHVEHLNIDDNEPLRVEQEAFLKAVADTEHRPEVTASEGLAAMECAERILSSIKKHDWKADLPSPLGQAID